jgi:hypothetical protein
VSVIAKPQDDPQQAEPSSGHPTTPCNRCGAPLRDDQEWCLECGTARTVIHPPPSWRVPATVVVVVVLLVLAGFAIALIKLSSDANRHAAGVSTSVPARSAAPRSAALPGWPRGVQAWTVVLAARRTETDAIAAADKLAASGQRVGILESSLHPLLKPGWWLVFAGRYPSDAAAAAQSARLLAKGYHARVRHVTNPSGP